jgi:hypothetical protein
MQQLHDELEMRIRHLEDPQNQGQGFTRPDQLWLLGLGIIAPILLLLWGWL